MAGGTASSGIINIMISLNITGRDILFVEDIIDTGKTLKSLKNSLKNEVKASVKIAALKPEGRLVELSRLHLLYEFQMSLL